MNALNNFDKIDRKCSLAPIDDLFMGSKVKDTAGRRGGESIHVGRRIPSSGFCCTSLVTSAQAESPRRRTFRMCGRVFLHSECMSGDPVNPQQCQSTETLRYTGVVHFCRHSEIWSCPENVFLSRKSALHVYFSALLFVAYHGVTYSYTLRNMSVRYRWQTAWSFYMQLTRVVCVCGRIRTEQSKMWPVTTI